ncbi:hypothetical protein A8709_14310 [Paenibacillus pectinilyticus]|uniref:ABC transporter substrate-binding protein n=2 Tax=Paenibacillus pectinilyticus TaxID=512399 RepID=A0A1C1A3Z5_9BACL|nr:hypothetical protein A8709_14310 [Paenibacillus pectinilyticus]
MVMFVVIVGCTKQEDEPSIGDHRAHQDDPQKAATVKIFGKPFAFNFESGIQNDDVAKEIRRQTGIAIDIESKPEDSKFEVMLASGDLPDIIVTERKYMDQLIQGNNVIALDELLGQHGQTLAKEMPERLAFSKRNLSRGSNKLYFIPGSAGKPAPDYKYDSPGWNIRWDYYRELGYPPYTQLLDLLPILKEMQDRHPTNERGQKVYALAPLFDFGLDPAIREFGSRFYGRSSTAGLIDVDNKTLEISSSILDNSNSFWVSMDFYFQANQLGLLDPDSFLMKFDNHRDKVKNNQVLFDQWSWAGVRDANKLFVDAGKPLQGWEPLPPVPGITPYVGEYGMNGNADLAWAITKSSKNPERAMDVLNYLLSYEGSRLMINGIQDRDWEVVDGKPRLKQETIKARKEDKNYSVRTGIGKYNNYQSYTNGAMDPLYQVPIDYSLSADAFKDNLTELDRAYSSKYGASYPGEVVDRLVSRGEIQLNYFDYDKFGALPTTPPDDIQRIQSQIDNYLQTIFPKLILAKNEVTFASLKAEVQGEVQHLGYNKVLAYYIDMYKKNKRAMEAGTSSGEDMQ